MSAVRITALIVLVGSVCAADEAGTPLMLNPGFELQAGGWPTDWTIAWGNREHAEWATDAAHGGTHSLKLTGHVCVRSPAYPYNGEVITVSGWLKLAGVRQLKPAGYRRVGIWLISLDADRQSNGHKDLILTLGTQDWTRYERTFTFAPTTKYFQVALLYFEPCAGTVWFDDVEVTTSADRYRPPARPFDRARATVTVDAARAGGAIPDLWRHIDNSYMTELPLPGKVDTLPFWREAGFRTVRMHECIYGPRIYREVGGRPHYDFERFDRSINLLLEHRLKPFIVLESTPNEMAAEQVRSYRNISKVVDLAKWEELIYRIVGHCIDKYGRDEVRSWYFELWNEPNSSGYYHGTLDDYLAMYDHTVAGATRADPGIRIGGPGGASNAWVLPLAEHCAKGTNAAAGQVGTRIDFFSWHIYCAGVGVPDFNQFYRSIQQVNDQLAAFPQYSDTPRIISEWSSNSSPAEWLNGSYRAPFLLKAILTMDAMGIELAHNFSVCEWLWDDQVKLYRKGLGFYTAAGVPKAPFHLFGMLNRLAGARAAAESSNDPIDVLAAYDGTEQALRVILGNWVASPDADYETAVRLELHTPAYAGRRVVQTLTRVTPTISNAYDDWVAMDRPQVDKRQLTDYRAGKRETAEQRQVAALIEGLKVKAALEEPQASTVVFDPAGKAVVELTMPVFSVYLLEYRVAP